MKRISTATKWTDKFGAGKHGYRNGDIPNAVYPTDLEAEIFDHMQEELARTIEAAGIALDSAEYTQLQKALKRIYSGNITTKAATAALTVDEAGLVLVDASGGDVTLTLPAANVLANLAYTFKRTDSSANKCIISRAGADTIEGRTTIQLPRQYAQRTVRTTGVSMWYTQTPSGHGLVTGECKLIKSGADLKLMPFNGNRIVVDGQEWKIPAAGLVLTPVGNAANATIQIYVSVATGAPVLEGSATAHTTDADSGIEVMTGTPSKSYVGIWRSGAAGNDWSSIETEGRSWFNRGESISSAVLASNTVSTSGTLAEVSSGMRAKFVCFANDKVSATLHVRQGLATAANYTEFLLMVDGATALGVDKTSWRNFGDTNNDYSLSHFGQTTGLAEGYHDLRAFAMRTGSNLTWVGALTSIQLSVRG